MSEAPLPPIPDAPRPLPRRGLPATTRSLRPRFHVIDALWIGSLIVLILSFGYFRADAAVFGRTGVYLAAGIAALLYLLGWRARDRAAGVTAALWAATSHAMMTAALQSPLSAAFTLLTVASLFAFVAGSSLAAGVLAGCATVLRPDGILLGAVLLALSLAQHRRRAWIGIILFVVLAAAGAVRIYLSHGMPPTPMFGLQMGTMRWLIVPASTLLLWFFLPFCAELGEPTRRARWLPVILWTALYLLSASLMTVATPGGMLLPLMPLVFALAGAGLSRLLPNLAGEIPFPPVRYLLAALAVLSIVGLYLRLSVA